MSAPAPASEQTAIAFMGRCVKCERPYRIEQTGEAAWCRCRAGVPCPLRNGWPACGRGHCEGHDKTAVKYRAVKVTYKPGVTCDSQCQNARGDSCACSCRGQNHGIAHDVAA